MGWTDSQEKAMNLRGKTLLVSAAAGSGKTSVLTERIIRTLTDRENPTDLSRLRVVTFTRAAAAELKSRIAAALTAAMAEHPGDPHLSRQLFLLGSAQISTIDSFFQKTVRANFEQLGLPPTFRIADESETKPLCMEVLGDVLDEFYLKYEKVTDHSSHLGQMEGNAFAAVLDHVMSNRSDGKLMDTLLHFHQRFTAYPEGITLLKTCAERLTADASKPFFASVYGKQIQTYLQELNQEHLSFLTEIDGRLSAEPDNYARLGGLIASDTDYCRRMKVALEQEEILPALSAAQSFVTGKFSSKEKTPAVQTYQTWRDKFKNEQKKYLEYLAHSGEEISEEMEKTASFCSMMYELFKEYEGRLLAEKKSRGVLEHNDIRAMLYGLLTTADGTPSPFAETLAAQYDAVYIDEYQDVDFMQDRIFAMIGGNHRFMVGDIKQSIYGFRGSEPSIFADYRKKMPLHNEAPADAEGVCVFMSENFRCDRPVIDFANRVCAFLFSACERSVGYRPDDDLRCSKREPENPLDGHPVPVQVNVFDPLPSKRGKSPEEDEDEEVTGSEEAIWTAAEISRLIREERLDDGRPITPADIAILVRTKKQSKAYVEALEALQIPVASATSSDILHDPLMTDLLNLLRTVDNPYRDLPLSEFLISPLGGYTLEEISQIRDAAPMEKALYDAMEAAAQQEDPLAGKVAKTLQWLERQQNTATLQPADRFLRLLYAEEPLRSYDGSPILLFLYEQARVYQRSSWCGLYGFLDHVDKLLKTDKVSAAGFQKAAEAVTVMTVHHSKGLEFPVVFLCSCAAPFNKDDLKQGLVFHRDVGCATKLYDPTTAENKNTVLRSAINLTVDLEQTEESIRTLYVALTRARERLYVSGTPRSKWDKLQDNAMLIKRGYRSSILRCYNPLTWILAALLEKAPSAGEMPWSIHHHPLGTVEAGIPMGTDPVAEPVQASAPVADPVALRYHEILRKHRDFVYPYAFLEGIPPKAAASKLKPDLLDTLLEEENEESQLEAQIHAMMASSKGFDTVLSDKERASAADIGTATHAFLQFCDFSLLWENGVEKECQRLVENGFLTEKGAKLPNRAFLELFVKSPLLQRILSAKSVRREQKFAMMLPLSDFTKKEENKPLWQEHSLFVQGSVDLLLEDPDGRLILVDYKTDRILPEEKGDISLYTRRLTEQHGMQLRCYAEAVRRLLGRVPDQLLIYALPLGDTVSIPTKAQ